MKPVKAWVSLNRDGELEAFDCGDGYGPTYTVSARRDDARLHYGGVVRVEIREVKPRKEVARDDT